MNEIEFFERVRDLLLDEGQQVNDKNDHRATVTGLEFLAYMSEGTYYNLTPHMIAMTPVGGVRNNCGGISFIHESIITGCGTSIELTRYTSVEIRMTNTGRVDLFIYKTDKESYVQLIFLAPRVFYPHWPETVKIGHVVAKVVC